MIETEPPATPPDHAPEGWSRRGFLQVSTLGTAGLTLAKQVQLTAPEAAKEIPDDKACILICNVGAPSHLDTWDPKPDAPREIRGPFRPITVCNGGFQISELFPLQAKIGDKFSLVRGMHSSAPPVHDVGYCQMQTGRPFDLNAPSPHLGCALGYVFGARHGLPSHVVLPAPLGFTGGNLPQGQGPGILGSAHAPFVPPYPLGLEKPAWEALDWRSEPAAVRERYGDHRLGRSCLLARRLVERGVRFVTVNAFSTVFHESTWDIHGTTPYSTMDDMKNVVAPMYDQAYSALLEDLNQRGLLGTTLVAALAEFGRTPRINAAGGRDHWPGCWTVQLAGGGVQGGRAVGASDAIGAYPEGHTFQPKDVVATIYHAFGLKGQMRIFGRRNAICPLVDKDANPIMGLF